MDEWTLGNVRILYACIYRPLRAFRRTLHGYNIIFTSTYLYNNKYYTTYFGDDPLSFLNDSDDSPFLNNIVKTYNEFVGLNFFQIKHQCFFSVNQKIERRALEYLNILFIHYFLLLNSTF